MKRFVKIALTLGIALLLAVPVFAAGGRDAAPAPAPGPNTPLEFLAGMNPGGGADFMLRNIERAIRANNLAPNPINFSYRPGGNMMVGMQYTTSQRGRGDLLMAVTQQLVGVPLTMETGNRWENMTPLAL